MIRSLKVLVPLVAICCSVHETFGAPAAAVSQPSEKSPSQAEPTEPLANQEQGQEEDGEAQGLSFSNGEWTVRVIRIYPPRESPAWRRHVVSFTTQYWRRRKGDKSEVLAYEKRGTKFLQVLAVLDNGTLLLGYLGYGTSVMWIPVDAPPRGEPLRLGGEEAHILRAWPDGAVIQPNRLNRASEVYFVPIKNNALDFSMQLRLADDRSVWSGSEQFARSRHLLLWLGNPNGRRNAESICLYNLKTHEKQVFPFREKRVALQGFDGTTAVIRQGKNWFIVFDTVRGEIVGRSSFAGALAEKDGFRYYMFRDWVPFGPTKSLQARDRVVAVDLASKEHATRVLNELVPARNSPKPKVVERGIEVWDGKKMLLVPWASREAQ